VGTGILLGYAIIDQNWARAALFIIYEAINIWGYINWKKKED